MDFEPDEGQRLLKETAREFFVGNCPSGAVLKMVETDQRCPDELWRQMAELGWMGIPFPEEYGGLGLGFLELCTVLEEMGRAALPGAFFPSVVLGGFALLLSGTEEQKHAWLPRIADGSCKATVAFYETDGMLFPERLSTKAEPAADGFLLTGKKLFVPAGDEADVIICPATTGTDEESLFLIETSSPNMTVRRLPTLDVTRPLSEVSLDGVFVPSSHLLGAPGRCRQQLAELLDYASTALCVEMIGGLQRVLAMTVEHAGQRVQFGKPIGSFQAVKHRCAEMHVGVVTAEAAARYAAGIADQALRGGSDALAYAASVAKTYVGQTFSKVAADAIQVHGGIGFTWEYDLHLYLKRAKGAESMLGNAVYHRERIMQMLGEGQ